MALPTTPEDHETGLSQAEGLSPSVSHWGSFRAELSGDRLVIHAAAHDPDPSPLIYAQAEYRDHPTRILRPALREGWLRARLGEKPVRSRGDDRYIEVDWDTALDLAASEIHRVRDDFGSDHIFAGSYGWSSAGRFHHAKSQLKRFFNLSGGCVEQVNNYSFGAGMVLLPHVIGDMQMLFGDVTGWDAIIAHSDLLLSFGGLPARNGQIESGGATAHVQKGYRQAYLAKGGLLINASPLRSDAPEAQEWLQIRPNTDTALILALCHELDRQKLTDEDFLGRATFGAARFRQHLQTGNAGAGFDAAWAEGITGVPAGRIASLARSLATSRSFINLNWSLQRAEAGEQSFWAAIALASMLGQIGKPGGGIGFGYGSMNGTGNPVTRLPSPVLPAPANPTGAFIPVARVTELLRGELRDMPYNGQRLSLPAPKLVYWAGGNPFHHHQDLNRLDEAWQRPDTVIVHDHVWTATARRADIVLPATMTLEREDIAASSNERFLSAMHRITGPQGEARDDYAIFAALAERLGFGDAFTEGRDPKAWIAHLYESARQGAARQGVDMPDFAQFWSEGQWEKPLTPAPVDALADFVSDPAAHPLRTPSGRIELWSDVIGSFGYADCPGGPDWLAPQECLSSPAASDYPLHLISPQPRHRLHSQLDPVGGSKASKIEGREPLRMNPVDAAARGLRQGQVVFVRNKRGALLAGLEITGDVMPRVVEMSTGAWFDPLTLPDGSRIDVHGNPNTLTHDRPTSALSQGPAAQSCLVEIAAWEADLPAVTVHLPPVFTEPGLAAALLARQSPN